MKMLVLQNMHRESGFRIAPNWPLIGKMALTLQLAEMISPYFLLLPRFSCQV